MSAENWLKVKDILRELMDAEPARRAAMLAAFETTPEIRGEVESLLALESECADFMSLPIADFSNDFAEGLRASSALPVGARIGIYEIRRELGAGGMGAVYLAERADGKFAQRVAVKMLRREFNVEKIRRHFEREKEILSKLEHPFVARLLDAGTTDDGVPYLVMEYVEGEPVDRYCAGLSLNDRLKLFIKICEAVSFAHQNLIVHRDLKPSNILVTAKGEPKLLDFGISKLLSLENAPEKTAITVFGAMTPAYASPEQIRDENVTTAADVYSLGVVLYKILTGLLPFPNKTNGELLKAIVEDDPAPPSSAVAKLKLQFSNEPGAKSEMRSPQSLSGDLDNIVLKALRKEPERRYRTVERFSADVARFIDGLPVSARRATVGYRLSKFYGRNKIAVAAAAFVFLSLISGVAVSLREARNAREQAQSALASRNLARNEQEKAEKVTRFMSKIIGYANPSWYAEGVKFGDGALVIDAVWDLSDKIDAEFSAESDVAAELHHKFTEVLWSVCRGKTGEDARKIRLKAIFHARRALELRKRFYGERHELVAKDLFYLSTVSDSDDAERAALLFEAIRMMRETNPNNLNFPYMLEAYTARLIMPEMPESVHETYRRAAPPAEGTDKYEIAERMLREALPVFRLHYREDNFPIVANECKLAYALAMQEKWDDFDAHATVCRDGIERLGEMPNSNGFPFKRFAEMVEKALIEKKMKRF